MMRNQPRTPFGVDDIAVAPALLQNTYALSYSILFPEWVSLTEHYWATSGERRSHLSNPHESTALRLTASRLISINKGFMVFWQWLTAKVDAPKYPALLPFFVPPL